MRLALVRACLLTGFLAACSSNPEVHKPSPLPVLPKPALQLERQWAVTVGKGLDGDTVSLRPALTGNLVIAASHDGVVEAVDSDGHRVWQRKLAAAITGGVSAGYGLVALGTAEGQVLVLNATDGQVRWTAPLGAAVLAPPLLLAGQVLVQCGDGMVYALQADNGRRRWTLDTPVPLMSIRGQAPLLAMADLVLIPTATGKLLAVDAESGSERWESQVATTQGRSEIARMTDIDGDMASDANGLYVVSYQGQLTALAVQNDEPHARWQTPLSSLTGVVAGTNRVYVADSDGQVSALDSATGKIVWRQQDLSWRGLSNVAVLGNRLVVGDAEGYLHLLAEDDGRILGRAQVKGAVVRLQRESDERVLVYSAKGQLSRWHLPGS